jgi:hypothetical protein
VSRRRRRLAGGSGPPLPRPYVAVLGPQSTAVDADKLIWAFFSGVQR